MKLLLIVAFIYVHFEYVSSDQNQEEKDLKEQIRNLQTEAKCIRQYLKEVCFNFNLKLFMQHLSINWFINFDFYFEQKYLKSLTGDDRSIKETYLSLKQSDTLSKKPQNWTALRETLTIELKMLLINDPLFVERYIEMNRSDNWGEKMSEGFKKEMSQGRVKGLHSQVIEDYMEILKLSGSRATQLITSRVMWISF